MSNKNLTFNIVSILLIILMSTIIPSNYNNSLEQLTNDCKIIAQYYVISERLNLSTFTRELYLESSRLLIRNYLLSNTLNIDEINRLVLDGELDQVIKRELINERIFENEIPIASRVISTNNIEINNINLDNSIETNEIISELYNFLQNDNRFKNREQMYDTDISHYPKFTVCLISDINNYFITYNEGDPIDGLKFIIKHNNVIQPHFKSYSEINEILTNKGWIYSLLDNHIWYAPLGSTGKNIYNDICECLK